MELSAVPVELLLPLAVFLPLAAAVVGAVGLRGGGRPFAGLVIATTGVTLLAVIALVPATLAAERLTWSVPALPGRFMLVADAFGVAFALFGAFVWFCATLYATAYLRADAQRVRFQLTSLVVLSANLGVVLAGNLLTLYVCFELLGLIAMVLVIHDGTDVARRAAVKYFWMMLVGGFALLAGIFLVHVLAGSGAIQPLPADAGPPAMVWSAFALLLIGFGVKSGMMPLHVWLPDAHPAAPAPASALLSGVMIKAGAYGIFRVLNMLFAPQTMADGAGPVWERAALFGLVVLWLGMATMLIAIVIGLGQRQAKRLLAWSSVSQMGFILAGLGAGAWLGPEGAMGTAGGLLHAINHALFKACLFLGIGAVAINAGTAELDRLGGLWRRMPVTFTCMLIATAGIAGVPLFNGFVSKSMIHHALVAAAGREGGAGLAMAEWIFLVTSVGTTALLAKLMFMVFIRRPRQPWRQPVREAAPAMCGAMIVLSLGILVLGLRPQWMLNGLIVPGLESRWLSVGPVTHFLEVYFLSWSDVLVAAGLVATGVIIYPLGSRLGLFRLAAPVWLGVDYWYQRMAVGFVAACETRGMQAARARAAVTRWSRAVAVRQLRRLSGKPSLLMLRRARWWAVRVLRRPARTGASIAGLLRSRLGNLARAFSLSGGLLRSRLGQLARAFSLSAGLPAERAGAAREDAAYRRLDRLRGEIIRDTLARARIRIRQTGGTRTARGQEELNAAHLIAGLLATRLLERTMSTVSGLSAMESIRSEVAAAERQEDRIAGRAVELAETWVAGGDLAQALAAAEASVTKQGDTRASSVVMSDWPAELHGLLFHPSARQWPITEIPDGSAVMSAVRGVGHRLTRDPGVGLTLAFGLLVGLTLSLFATI